MTLVAPSRSGRGKYLEIFLCVFLLLAVGCGRKAPPVPLVVVTPDPIENLNGEIIGDQIRLSWTVPTNNKDSLSGIKGFQIFKYQSSDFDTLCYQCPIPFKKHVFIKGSNFPSAQVGDARIVYNDTIDPSLGYAYKVVVHHRSGGTSDDSNVFFAIPRLN